MINPHPGPRICLDFGTSYSKASIFLADGPAWRCTRPLALGAASGADTIWLTPSALSVDSGRIRLGPSALASVRAQHSGASEAMLSFKTILAARDLDQALNMRLRRTLDPTGSLSHRDALVLYLAHLDRLTRAAAASDLRIPSDAAALPRRYTTPIWRQRQEADRIVGRLFDEAASVSERLGDALIGSEGVSIAHAKDALERAGETLGIGQLETGVFEAHAAAAAYGACKEMPARCFLLIDMGAGTTDLAGFEHDGGDRLVMSEIVEARQSCGLAGDEIDQILITVLAAKKRMRDRAAAEALWQGLRLSSRDLKRELFETGGCRYERGGVKLSATRKELLAHADTRAFVGALSEVVAASLAAVRARAQHVNAGAVTILLAGGGAHSGLLADAARAASLRLGLKNAELEHLGVGWRLPQNSDAGMQSAMPQLAISMGGALAELETAGERLDA